MNELRAALTNVNSLVTTAEQSGSVLFATVDTETALDIHAIFALSLRQSSAHYAPNISEDERSLHRQIRKSIGGQVYKLARSTLVKDAPARTMLIMEVVCRSQSLICYSRLLADAAEQLQQRPSRRNVQAALQTIGDALDILYAWDWTVTPNSYTVLPEGTLGPSGRPLLTRKQLGAALSSELQSSQVLESWATCILHIAACDDVERSTLATLLWEFGDCVRRVVSALQAYGCPFVEPGPALQYLLSLQAVQLAALHDGGTMYGLTPELAALLPVQRRPSGGATASTTAAVVSSTVATSGLKMGVLALTQWEATLAQKGPAMMQQRRQLRAEIRALKQQRLALGPAPPQLELAAQPAQGPRDAAGEAWRVAAKRLYSAYLPLRVLPYNARVLFGLCMRLARAGCGVLRGAPALAVAAKEQAGRPLRRQGAAAAAAAEAETLRQAAECGLAAELAAAAIRCARTLVQASPPEGRGGGRGGGAAGRAAAEGQRSSSDGDREEKAEEGGKLEVVEVEAASSSGEVLDGEAEAVIDLTSDDGEKAGASGGTDAGCGLEAASGKGGEAAAGPGASGSRPVDPRAARLAEYVAVLEEAREAGSAAQEAFKQAAGALPGDLLLRAVSLSGLAGAQLREMRGGEGPDREGRAQREGWGHGKAEAEGGVTRNSTVALQEDGKSRLFSACEAGDAAEVKRLLEGPAGWAVNAPNSTEKTPLHVACKFGHAGVVAALLRKGARTEAKDVVGHTPLHKAASFGHTKAAALLVAAGADLGARDNWGKTPLDLARKAGEQAAVQLLEARQAGEGQGR